MRKFIQNDLADWLASAPEEDLARFSKLYHAVDDASDISKLAPLIEGEMLLDCESGFAVPIRDNFQNVVGSYKAVINGDDIYFIIQHYD